MRITLANEHSARAVGIALERYGYAAQRSGSVLLTYCPALLAVALAERTVGVHRIVNVELADRRPRRPAQPPERAAG